MGNYLIIADDFTGSNDTGVQLSRRGLRTKVVLDGNAVKGDGLSYVLDTESRNISADEAEAKSSRMLEAVDFSGFDCVIKKVDSTLRGNIAREILASDRAYKSELVIFMPALPSLGRTTVNSIHMLNGVRILETELSKDPRKPVTQDNIAEILSSVYAEPVGTISLEQIRSGSIDLSAHRLYACDAVTDDDMRAVICTARASGKRTLWVGTAAIADNIMSEERPMLPAFAVITSVSDVMRQQLHYAEEKGLEIIGVDIAKMLEGADIDYADKACKLLSSGKDLALVSSASYDRAQLELSVEAGTRLGMDATEVAEYACTKINLIAADILDRVKVSGLFLSGGDTAIHFFSQVGADGSEIISELSVGIPMMKLSGGRFDGMKVITKAGAFGGADAMTAIMRKLCEA